LSTENLNELIFENSLLWYVGRYSYTMKEFDKLEKIVGTEDWEPKDVERILEQKSYIKAGLRQMDSLLGEKDFSIDDFKTVSQGESQKISYIDRVLLTLDRYEYLNTTEIINKSGLSNDSVVRTLKLLREKKIVWVKTKNNRQNNEKIYSLRRFRAMCYMSNLLWWKNARKSESILKFEKKIDSETEKLLPRNFDARKVFFNNRMVAIKDLPTKYKRGIRQAYSRGFYCERCFNSGYVYLLVRISEYPNVCPRCGAETPFEEEIRMTARQYKRHRNLKRKGSKN